MADSQVEFWNDGDGGRGGPRRIEDYGLIGDSETAALVGRDGSIDWLCWPRFDSEAGLAALLGDATNGYWQIAPSAPRWTSRRRYRGDTLILETLFESDDGTVLLTDLMPIRGTASDIVRIVEGKSGCVPLRSALALRFGYGRLCPLLRRINDREVSALAGPHAVVLRSDHPLDLQKGAIQCNLTLREGEKARFVLTYFPSHRDIPEPVDPERALAATERYWTEWVSRCTYEGPYRDLVIRSLITLKALTHRPTGGTVAAPTSSLPETPGGQRNWDYRYCWLRDAAFMLLAFMHGGYLDEAAAWRNWLLRAVAGMPGNVKPLYAIDGSQGIFEVEAPWLQGFGGAQPVRFGNAAHSQVQLDTFGEVIDAFHLARRNGLEPFEESWELQRDMLLTLEERWHQPDAGIWEVRSAPQHFVHSKALAWAAFDRGVRDFQHADGHIERWQRTRDRIWHEVMERGFNREKNSFTRAYGTTDLDASTLILPLIGFIHPRDPRAVGTVEAIERELMPHGLVRRYDPDVSDDGLPGREGVFLACSFWLADNYYLQGRRDDAERLFEKIAGLANDLGLLPEEYSPEKGMMLGNFPQAITHVALVNTAYNLSEIRGPAEERLSLHA